MDFLRVFYAPSGVEYTRKKWLKFFIASFIAVSITFFLNVHFNYEGILNTMLEKVSSMSEEQKIHVLSMLNKKRMLIQGYLSIIITLPLKVLSMAGILYFIRMLFGKEDFSISLFAASVYTYVQAVGDFVRFLLSILFKTFPFLTDLSILVDKKGFLSGFLTVFDIFTIYAMYVAALIVSGNEKERKWHYFVVLIGLLLVWGIIKGLMLRAAVK